MIYITSSFSLYLPLKLSRIIYSCFSWFAHNEGHSTHKSLHQMTRPKKCSIRLADLNSSEWIGVIQIAQQVFLSPTYLKEFIDSARLIRPAADSSERLWWSESKHLYFFGLFLARLWRLKVIRCYCRVWGVGSQWRGLTWDTTGGEKLEGVR